MYTRLKTKGATDPTIRGKAVYLEQPHPESASVTVGDGQQLFAAAERLVQLGFEQGDVASFTAAADIYRDMLAGTSLLPGTLPRAAVENNLGSVHCLIAQFGAIGISRTAHLNEATALLKLAASVRKRSVDPSAWATTQTNIAIVHLVHYAETKLSMDLFAANVALGAAEEEFDQLGDVAALAWIASIRAHAKSLQHP